MSGSIGVQRREAPGKTRADALAQQYEERRRRQAVALAQLDCLQGAPSRDLLRLAHMCTLRAFPPGTPLLNERTPGEFLYLVLRGTVSLTLHDRAGHEVLIGVLNRGDCFGEGPLFGDLFRGATVQSETICYLLQLPLAEVRGAMAESPELAGALRAIYRRRLVEGTLGRVPLFSRLSPLERAGIAGLLQPQQYPRGVAIIHEGEPGDALYLIESGQVVVEREGQLIAHLDEGDFFGEMSLLAEKPHNADIRTVTPAEVLALPAEDFMRLLAEQPALAEQLHEVVEQRRETGATMRRDPTRVHQFTAAVANGLLRGTHVLVRDPKLCLDGCRICEDACAARHGQTRIHTGGVLFNGLDVTDSCRQCRVGAECVEACPVDAIQWNDRGALIITGSCTGCGDCVPACPYDAVHLVSHDQQRTSPLWSLWHQIKRFKQPTIPLTQTQPTQRADKCDLCHGYDDLACVSACPTGAIRLMPVEELFPL
ncbi:MAG TPA: cyclic nucleotide-binding domain-containing protein [Roseiflexaceae bacterium]